MIKFVDKNGNLLMEEKDNGELNIVSEKLKVSFNEAIVEDGDDMNGNDKNK